MGTLSGKWKVAPADDELRREFPDPDHDDDDWLDLEVPGHWRDHPDLAHADGPMLYRTQFDAPHPAEGERWWVELGGLFYQGDVWLDGSYLGDTEGYFIPHAFEATSQLTDRSEHTLAVEVTCHRSDPDEPKRQLLGVFDTPGELMPDWNPGGIWQPVRLHRTGPVRIEQLRAVSIEASENEAVVAVRASMHAAESGTIRITTRLAGITHVGEHNVAARTNQVDWRVTVPQPELWWPHSLGSQPLHDLRVAIETEDGRTSDQRLLRIGLRSVRMRNWSLTVNGERLFLKGSNLAPTRPDLARVDRARVEGDLALAKAAGLDLLRVYGHIGHPTLYEVADETGMLLWQDMPLVGGYARGVRKQAVRHASAATALLAHHPSIVTWCAQTRPSAGNRAVLGRSVRRELERTDKSRTAHAHAGVLPDAPALGFGWKQGDERELATFAARLPRAVRFPSELGAQAVPNSADFARPDRWPWLDWEQLAKEHGYDREIFDVRVPPRDHDSFESWRTASQAYQSMVIRRQVETLRRLKDRPTGGFLQHFFVDAYPAITSAVVDHQRTPKSGYAALAAACRPVIVVADRLPQTLVAGEEISLAVHVVSDLHEALEGCHVAATMSWPGRTHTWRWIGDVEPNAVALIGSIDWTPPQVEGTATLTLTLTGPANAQNRYDTRLSG